MKKPTKKPEHRPIVIKDALLTKEESERIKDIGREVIKLRQAYQDATCDLVKEYRDIVGYENIEMGVDDCDFDWYQSPEEWVKAAKRQRSEWLMEELKA